MGINLEYITLLSELRKKGVLPTGTAVCEFGAQSISTDPVLAADHLRKCGIPHSLARIDSAAELYRVFGYDQYTCIDAAEGPGVKVSDLSKNLREFYGFVESFDMVTNLGTLEHVFDIATAFRNAHDLSKVGGYMIHVLPSNCNINHGYYCVQPRMIENLCATNNYTICEFVFTVDYTPILRKYELDTYKAYDDRDLMFYAVLRKEYEQPFKPPFDSVFSQTNALSEYAKTQTKAEFKAYIKSTWMNVKPKKLKAVPTSIVTRLKRSRRLTKAIIDHLGCRY
jgi:SAM-dependent methyltransferase